ncbi:MAG TPA: Npt1/Npt2 family nucleotide transporter [Polyangiaceae bacterium]|nr:Npt1/Npt2 family nucleotide transporter [Polyangiaceae bacterium]
MTQSRLSASFDPTPAVDAARPSALERVLGIVTEVRAGEGATALLLATALFLLLMAYYIIKPVREALILQHPAGAEYKSWLGAAIAVLLLVVVPAYSKLADRLPRNLLVSGVTLFFASHLVLFYLASITPGVRESLSLSLTFFVWVGIFNMMLVAQLWAFANDVYDQERGKRLFVIVGLGASFGAIAGGTVTSALSSVFDMFDLLLLSAVFLVGVAFITQVVHRRELRAAAGQASPGGQAQPSEAPLAADAHDRSGAFAMVFRHRYLLLIAAFSLVWNFVNTNGEYMFGKLIKAAAESAVAAGTLHTDEVRSFIGSRYNSFFTIVNVLSFVFQFVVVSRLLKRAGFGPAFFIFPVIAFLDGSAVAVAPLLAVLFVGKIAENSVDYSLNNTLRNMLWLPTTREMKYKAKQAVDTFFVRMGDVASGLWVVVGAGMLHWGVRPFAITNAVLAGIWLWLAGSIVKEQRRLEGTPAEVPVA